MSQKHTVRWYNKLTRSGLRHHEKLIISSSSQKNILAQAQERTFMSKGTNQKKAVKKPKKAKTPV
jgi:hypothetical protein